MRTFGTFVPPLTSTRRGTVVRPAVRYDSTSSGMACGARAIAVIELATISSTACCSETILDKTIDPPEYTGTVRAKRTPVMCAIGFARYIRSIHPIDQPVDIWMTSAIKVRCEWTAPLGSDVVPEVNNTRAGSSGFADDRSLADPSLSIACVHEVQPATSTSPRVIRALSASPCSATTSSKAAA